MKRRGLKGQVTKETRVRGYRIVEVGVVRKETYIEMDGKGRK